MPDQILTKMIIIGDAEVGKTSLAYQYTNKVFSEEYIQTIGTNFLVKDTVFQNYNITLQIWDTAGQERFQRLLPNYYKGAQIAFVVYSITDKKSFENVGAWFKLAKKYGDDPLILLIGNKLDLEQDRQVTAEEGKKLASSLGVSFLEASAKTAIGVEDAFNLIIQQFIADCES